LNSGNCSAPADGRRRLVLGKEDDTEQSYDMTNVHSIDFADIFAEPFLPVQAGPLEFVMSSSCRSS
jgi:hypothetical protein